MRYRGKSRYKKRSTNVVTMKFQSFMDISTDDASMQVISISAGGREILKRLSAQFAAYKYYKLGNVAIKLVPATTLPVDPSGLSINAGGQGVDPWDQLSPGLIRITNGEDIFENMAGLNTAEMDAIFKNMQLDPRWYKFMLQTGVKRHASPRYWQVGQFHQDKWPGAVTNFPELNTDGDVTGTVHTFESSVAGVGVSAAYAGGSSPLGLFQTGHSGVLGWMPTDSLQYIKAGNSIKAEPFLASPPEIEVIKIILPRASLTKYPYRLYVTETVYFREPIVNFGVPYDDPQSGVMYLRPLDVFHTPGYPVPRLPQDAYGPADVFPLDSDTGGNYGDD